VSDALQKAEAAVVKAEANTDVLAVAMAALELAKGAQQPQHICQHDHQPRKEFDARKWWTIGGFVVVGGCVACALALAFALAAVAIAIGATCATGCLLVLRSMWRDYLTNR
jgi:ABC-type nickel/cobalt efflux system permease component RcnA